VKLILSSMVFLLVTGISSAAAMQLPRDEALTAALTEPLPQSVVQAADRSRVIYVSNFDLDLPGGVKTPPPPGPTQTPAAADESKAEAKPEAKKEETISERTVKFIDFVSNALIKELEGAGYSAQRLRPGDPRPDQGIRISGVFAEPDDQNRWRRAMVGSQNVGPMSLFVSVGNLSHPDQALYAIADPKSATPTIGPVISVSAYAPLARFPLPKSATEKTVRDIVGSIVADLTMLLRTNTALAH
jgi:hypothetical protein